MISWLKSLFGGGKKTEQTTAPSAPRPEFVQLVETLDYEGIESARDVVTTEDMPSLVRFYFQLEDWNKKLRVIDLTCDQHHPDMTAMMKDVLRAPGEGDWVDLPKATALGYLSEDHDQFMRYYNDRSLLRQTVLEVLKKEGLTLDVEPEPEPTEAAQPAPQVVTLREAAKNDDVAAIRTLLAQGHSPNPTEGGDSPLLCAALAGATHAALALLEAGADANATRETASQTALWWAAGHGDILLMKALLAHGAQVDARDQWGANALQQAASSGHTDAVKLLLSHNADFQTPYHDGRTVLNFSIRGGSVAAVEALLDAGADLQSKQSTFTPLAFACFEGTAEMVELLVKRGAAVDATVDYHGLKNATPLMLAAGAGKVRMIKALLAGGADRTLKDANGKTAADHAKGNRADAVRAALSA